MVCFIYFYLKYGCIILYIILNGVELDNEQIISVNMCVHIH